MPSRRRYISLDILRGLSCLLIILYHWTYRFNENCLNISGDKIYTVDYPLQFPWGCAAVVTFFMLSGFLVGRMMETSDCNKSKGYFVGRLIRLYPTFWTGVCLTTVIMLVSWPAASVSLTDFLLNLTMIPNILHVQSVDGAYWTMQIEIIFSCCFGMILLLRKEKIKWIALIIWCLLCLLYEALPYWGVNAPSQLSVIIMPKFSYMFIGGISIYNIILRRKLTYPLVILFLCVIDSVMFGETYAHKLFFILTCILLFFTLRLDNCIVSSSNLFIKSIRWLASISYPLYLIHQMIGFAFIRQFHDCGITSEWILIVPFIFCSFTAWLIHKYVEVPTSGLASGITKRM